MMVPCVPTRSCTRPRPGCTAPGDFYIDPVRPVPRALITHGHGDHARSGHGAVMATQQTLDIMAIRYGEDFTGTRQAAEGVARIGDVQVSFHPAGHILGSAQIAVMPDRGPKIVVSGDIVARRTRSARLMNPSPATSS